MYYKRHKDQRGSTIIEFAFIAVIFFMMLVGIAAAGHLYFTHNALVEATRRGVRYAVLQCKQGQSGCTNSGTSIDRIQKVAVYGTDNPAVGATPLVSGLQQSNIDVQYSPSANPFGVGSGSVTVKIINYSYPFVLPLQTTTITMPPSRTTMTGENAGFIPPDI